MGLEDVRYDAENCTRCSNCKWIDHVYVKSHRYAKICPSSVRYVFDSYSAQGRQDIALAVMNGELDYTPSLVSNIYECTMCGACDIMCKRCIDLEVLSVLAELRSEAYRRGATLAQHDALVSRVKDSDNPWGVPREVKFQWLRGLGAKDIREKPADVLFFAGCAPQDSRLQSIPRQSIAIMTEAGVDVGVLGEDEKCCGAFAHQVGERNVSVDLIRENIERFNGLGISTLVTSCAACFGAFQSVYPAYGNLTFKVLHISQLLDQLLRANKLEFSHDVNLTATYHDPCHLGRLGEPYVGWEGTRGAFGRQTPPKKFRRGTNGVYEPPRNVLTNIRGLQLVEMERIRENAWCCGAGGGVKTAYGDFALWSAKERLREASETGAEALVTACPHCTTNFADAIDPTSDRLRVLDLVEIAAQALGGGR